MPQILRLGEGLNPKTYWIELPKATSHGDGYVIGREVKSLGELEAVAAQIHADLERVIEQARAKLKPS